VSPAFRAGAHLATRHLIERGHREILHVTSLHRSTCRKRLDGFRDALRGAGLPFRDDMVINLDSYAADFVERAMAEKVASGPLPATAVFCVTDSAALGLISALRRAGYSVPRDLSVIGFDDMPMSALFAPRLTTIHVDREAIGRAAVERLIARVAMPDEPAWRIELGGHLAERDSVAAR